MDKNDCRILKGNSYYAQNWVNESIIGTGGPFLRRTCLNSFFELVVEILFKVLLKFVLSFFLKNKEKAKLKETIFSTAQVHTY